MLFFDHGYAKYVLFNDDVAAAQERLEKRLGSTELAKLIRSTIKPIRVQRFVPRGSGIKRPEP